MAELAVADKFLQDRGIKGMDEAFRKMINDYLVEFDAVDKDKTGSLNREEVEKLCEVNKMFKDRGIEFIFERLDFDKSNTITREEFMCRLVKTWAARVYISRFESRGDNTVDHICTAMGGDGYDVNIIKEFIQNQNLEVDGKVSLPTFLGLYFDLLKRT